MPTPQFDPYGIYDVAGSSSITIYDRANFLTYARILDAVRFAQRWDEAAAEILDIDVSIDRTAAFGVWSAHVDRANWLVADGLPVIASGGAHPQHLAH